MTRSAGGRAALRGRQAPDKTGLARTDEAAIASGDSTRPWTPMATLRRCQGRWTLSTWQTRDPVVEDRQTPLRAAPRDRRRRPGKAALAADTRAGPVDILIRNRTGALRSRQLGRASQPSGTALPGADTMCGARFPSEGGSQHNRRSRSWNGRVGRARSRSLRPPASPGEGAMSADRDDATALHREETRPQGDCLRRHPPARLR
jgi:hypothetical protein